MVEVRFVGFGKGNEMVVGFLLRLIDRQLHLVRMAAVRTIISHCSGCRRGSRLTKYEPISCNASEFVAPSIPETRELRTAFPDWTERTYRSYAENLEGIKGQLLRLNLARSLDNKCE